MAELNLVPTDDIEFKSKDGTDVHGLLTKPEDYKAGTPVPTILFIHGGPNGQDEHSFDFLRQWLATKGYAELNVNYRGSSGRGQDYSKAIAADWGDKEVQDLLAGVDKAVAMGVADPDKLAVTGWSYGGILTDYTDGEHRSLQSRDQRRRRGCAHVVLRRRSVRSSIRQRTGPTLEEPSPLYQDELPVS